MREPRLASGNGLGSLLSGGATDALLVACPRRTATDTGLEGSPSSRRCRGASEFASAFFSARGAREVGLGAVVPLRGGILLVC